MGRVVLRVFVFFLALFPTYGFRCDAMFSLIGGKVLPDSFVNDDYCDCDDRSDEPNTNACAMLTKSKGNSVQMFTCRDTKGYAPFSVPSHLKGDGVCDCCDGSDELEGICPDKCAIWAEEENAKVQIRQKALEAGKAKFDHYVKIGKEAQEEYKKEIEELKLQENDLENKVDEAQTLKETLAVKEKETRAIHKAESQAKLVEQLKLSEVADPVTLLIHTAIAAKENGVQSLMALLVEKLDGSVTDGMDDVEVLSLGSQAQILWLNKAGEDAAAAAGGGASTEGASTSSLVEVVNSLKQALGLDKFSDMDMIRELCLTLAQDLKEVNLLVTLSRDMRSLHLQDDQDETLEDPSSWDNWKLPELTEVTNNLKNLQNEKRTITNKLKDLTIADNSDFGKHSEWFSLSRKCFSKNTAGFDYKICPFKDAKQDSTNLGKWIGWDQDNKDEYIKIMKFDKGTKCWNGPSRSLDVEVSCGSEDEILSVEEPETCKYIAQMTSPAACSY